MLAAIHYTETGQPQFKWSLPDRRVYLPCWQLYWCVSTKPGTYSRWTSWGNKGIPG